MTPDHADIYELVQHAWTSLVGLDASRSESEEGPAAAAVSSCVVVTGSWEGTVVLECDEELARRATSRMLGTSPEQASDGDMRDVISELANIVTGGIRRRLPAPNEMSRPAVRHSARVLPTGFGGTPVARAVLLSEGLPLRVTVVGSVPRSGASARAA